MVCAAGRFPSAGYHRVQRDQAIGESVVIWCRSGQGWLGQNNQQLAIEPGQLVWTDPDQPHAYGARPNNAWTIDWFHLRGQGLFSVLQWWSSLQHEPRSLAKSQTGPGWLTPADPDRLEQTIAAAIDELESAEDAMVPALSVLSHELVGCIGYRHQAARKHDDAWSTPDRVRQIMRFMHDHMDQSHRVEDLAERALLSPGQLNVWFHRLAGCSPMQYLKTMRLQAADQWLRESSDEPIKSIAARVGYDDPLYFSRHYARYFGYPPSLAQRKA